jgi:hypothetical protein
VPRRVARRPLELEHTAQRRLLRLLLQRLAAGPAVAHRARRLRVHRACRARRRRAAGRGALGRSRAFGRGCANRAALLDRRLLAREALQQQLLLVCTDPVSARGAGGVSGGARRSSRGAGMVRGSRVPPRITAPPP